jgi:DNA methylase/ParB-like nuclease domain
MIAATTAAGEGIQQEVVIIEEEEEAGAGEEEGAGAGGRRGGRKRVIILKTSKYAGKVPPLSKQDCEALRESLRKRGFLSKYPIIINPNGDVLDGHHRLRLCRELGIQPVFAIEYAYVGDEIEEELFVRQINRARRQLPLWQKIEMALEDKPLLAKQAERNMMEGKTLSPDKERVHTDKKLASELGIGTGTLWMVEQVIKTAQQSPENNLEYSYDGRYRGHEGPSYAQLLEDARAGKLSPVEAYNALKRDQRIKAKRAETKASISGMGLPQKLTLLNMDSTTTSAPQDIPEIPDNSVDLIVTDPPYMKKYLPVFEALAGFAARKLKEGGSLLFYYNVGFEPDIHRMFAKYEDQLTWWWRFHVHHGGDTTRVHDRQLRVEGKDMMWFVKGKKGRLTGNYIMDWIQSKKPDKDLHPWAQSGSEAEYLIEGLTISEDSLVVDPFLGSGAFAIPAIRLGRYFIGIEIDKDVYERAKNYIIKETTTTTTTTCDAPSAAPSAPVAHAQQLSPID